ncbi:hypothetical protein ACFLZT_06770 [Thermodesulfobacteriota bacterium]
MGFEYITGTAEKTLSPFFSKRVLSAVFKSTLVLGMIMVGSWPDMELFTYIHEGKYPLLFLRTFAAALIINSYINLRCGRGELYAEENYYKLKTGEVKPFELERNFFSYGLIETVLHTAMLLLFFVPILMISARISGITLICFNKACLVLYTSSLVCRLFGFLMYPLHKKSTGTGYIVIRLFYVFFMFGTLYIAPYINPIMIINYLHSGEIMIIFNNITFYSFYMMTVLFAVLILITANYFMVKNFQPQKH